MRTERSLVPALVALWAALMPSAVSAQVYSWRDESGRLVLADRPQPGAAPLVKAYPPEEAESARVIEWGASERARMYEDLIVEHARRNDIRPALVRAVVQVESAFNPYAVSPKGARGLMQLMPATAQRFGVKNVYNPEENVRAGVAYLRQLLDRYNNDEKLALAAYNAGPGAVDKYGQKVPPYSETRNYVAQITQITTPRIEPREHTIYRVTEIVDGREVVRYTDKRPAPGSYQILSR